MKNQIIQKTILSVLAVAAIPALASAATKQYIGTYTVGTTASSEETYIQFEETSADNTVFTSQVKVNSMLADSGGTGSSCSWCQLDTDIKKKGLLWYSSIGSKTIKTTTTGTYTGPASSKGGNDTYRFYVTNDNHFSNSGQVTVTTQS